MCKRLFNGDFCAILSFSEVAGEKTKGRRRVERSGLSKVQFEVRLRDGNAAGFFFWSATSLYRIMLITTLNCSHIYNAVI